ncbi:MAG: acyl-CoA synthetase [Henriciella sp.]
MPSSTSLSDEAFNWAPPATFNFASDVVDHWANDPDRLALICVDGEGVEARYTYADIARQSCQLANQLRADGLIAGDRVIVMLPRIAAWQIAMTAVLRIGAVPIPCITMLTAKDLEYRAEHSGAVGVITRSEDTAKFANLASMTVRVAVGEMVEGWTSLSAASSQASTCDAAKTEINDPAILYYTSGSTGNPKGVTHSAGALWAWSNSAIHWLGLNERERIWCTADTGWSKAGTSILFGPWSQGASVLFYDGPFDPAKRLELLETYEVTCFCAAATELRQLVLQDFTNVSLARLRSTVSAGESVNPEIIHRWKSLTGTTVLDGYGQTETLMTITNRPGWPVKPGSMGRALPGIEAAVLTGEGAAEARDAEGELMIGLPNPQVMLGYWQDDNRTQAAMMEIDGRRWFKTGDNVHIDEDGFIFYTGRADDIINSSGYRIGPQEVENVLTEHGAVQECAVTGVPDAERGELVKAWIVLNDGHAGSAELVAELQQHVKATTAPYKYPRAIEFVSELPKTVTGKIRRNLLRESAKP